MSTKNGDKAKPRTKPAKSKGGRSVGRSPAKARAGKGKPKAARPRTNRGGAKRLRPGELDGLVIAYMREHDGDLPLGASAIAKGIGRSSGAVANCLEREAKADGSPVRRAKEKPRAYDLKAEAGETPS